MMNRLNIIAFRLLLASFILCTCFAATTLAQAALEPAPPLPAGMTGSDANDPRAKLTPGLFDAGETAMGIKHILLLKKPDAFQLGVDPNGPKVEKGLTALGIASGAPIPGAMRMSLAGLAFANSDLAFQGNHLFLGNFYGINIYDIADPAKAKLVTSMLCPGGQGDVSVFKNLLFMSVEMPNGRLDCGEQGFAPPAATGRRTGSTTGSARCPEGPISRSKDLRYQRHSKSEAGGCCADVPRFAHAYVGDRPE